MADKHDVAHYAIAGLLLLAGAYGWKTDHDRLSQARIEQPSRIVWPGLDDAASQALSGQLGEITKSGIITVWCGGPNCENLAQDIQVAAYNAGWDTHADRSSLAVPAGIVVSPADDAGKKIAAALSKALGIQAAAVGLLTETGYKPGYSISIGDRK